MEVECANKVHYVFGHPPLTQKRQIKLSNGPCRFHRQGPFSFGWLILCDIVNLVRKEQNAPNQPFSSHIQPNSEPYEHIDFCTVVVLGKRQIINPFALEMINGIALYQAS